MPIGFKISINILRMTIFVILPYCFFATALGFSVLNSLIIGRFFTSVPILENLSMLFLVFFFAAVVFDVLFYIFRGQPKDIWKLGWFGVFGALGSMVPVLTVFYVFFAFFGLKLSEKS